MAQVTAKCQQYNRLFHNESITRAVEVQKHKYQVILHLNSKQSISRKTQLLIESAHLIIRQLKGLVCLMFMELWGSSVTV